MAGGGVVVGHQGVDERVGVGEGAGEDGGAGGEVGGVDGVDCAGHFLGGGGGVGWGCGVVR